jgi:phenylalanyl-tRNA synthetase beta chain
MYLSLKWLRDYVEIPKSLSPEDLGLRLTMHTVEIDKVEKQSERYHGVVVGKILEISKHPNADRLQVAKVDIGKEELVIVCGAPNIEVGQLVPVATVGTVLPNGLEIKEAEVRGAKSCGMLCAEDEIGLGEDHSGIMILPAKAKIGQALSELLSLDDVIFEVDNKSITNRPDLWGHAGMARDMAVFLDAKFTPPSPKIDLSALAAGQRELSIKIDDKLCSRYCAVAMDGIEVKESPQWMQERLIAAGMRPINNVVDVTNYVMLELGQPMHAFDAAKISKIVVRRAKKGETLETLDAVKRELLDSDLVITDSKQPVAIAGIMGGVNSGIDSATTSLVFESANFDYVAVRKTSQRLGLRTESSMRFEKSLDPNMCLLALTRAVELMLASCPTATVSSTVFDHAAFKLNQGPIVVPAGFFAERIGQAVEAERIEKILSGLGFALQSVENGLSVTVPTWRATKDVSIKEDLLEEVARIIGYDNITPVMPKVEMKAAEENVDRQLERRIKFFLASIGLSESYNYSFVGEEQLKKIAIDFSNHIRLANPISAQHTMLRQSLFTNLLQNIRTNQSRFDEFGIFEVGSIYLSSDGSIKKDGSSSDNLPFQEKRVGIVLAGADRGDLFSRVKGIAAGLIESLGASVHFRPAQLAYAWADPVYSTEVVAGDNSLGTIFRLDNEPARQSSVKKEVFYCEFSLSKLMIAKKIGQDRKIREFDKFPPAVRDLAFVVASDILYGDISREIYAYSELVRELELFDVYEGGKLGEGKKSLAFHIQYQADRTMTSAEVDELQKGLIALLESKYDAKVRDF